MEKHKNYQTQPSQSLIPNTIPDTNLFNFLPKSFRSRYELQQTLKDEDCLYECIRMLHTHNKVDQLQPFFQQIGADLMVWQKKSLPQQKSAYIFEMLEKNVQEGIKRINLQGSSYVNLINTNRKIQKRNKNTTDKQKTDQFEWLVLNTKNEMLKSKLKTKLVQTINEYKNEKKLRDVMGKQLQDHQKIQLQDESLDLYQDDKSKINYNWTKDDQEMFIGNIKKLKQKFTQTEFLKNCHRYKFITNSQIKTLAAQQISRKLDKNNKAFLSRQFLLDKYFSTNENLTQKQMKFILKTSPLLSKCVDKAFVRSAIKNIRYQDIDKMELQIAQEIIEKFEMIRNLVKNSRKMYKQKLNNKVKKRIEIFEREKQYKQVRDIMNQKLNIHKTKMLRNLNYRPNSTKSRISQNRRNHDTAYEDQSQIPQKMIWPVPLNNKHPSTGLFIKDCSEQLNDEFNQYQKNYIKKVQKSQDLPPFKKSLQSKAQMINFYTGGPLQSCFNNYNKYTSAELLKKSKIQNKNQKIDSNVIKTVCQAFKINEYHKELMEKLNSFQLIDEDDQEGIFIDKRMFAINKNSIDFFMGDMTKRTKKLNEEEESIMTHSGYNPQNKGANSTEKVIKDKILEGKQKAKMTVYVKKLLSLAAQNSFISLKALNAKFTPSQINTYDAKGNTALFYATKHKNSDFIDYLLGMKADVNAKCSKNSTPLHNAFKTSNYSIICKCLTGAYPPNLNAIDDEGKTPLAYCCRKVLQMLNLQQGVVSVLPGQKIKFNNNFLLTISNESKTNEDQLQAKIGIKRKASAKQIR